MDTYELSEDLRVRTMSAVERISSRPRNLAQAELRDLRLHAALVVEDIHRREKDSYYSISRMRFN